MSEVTFRAKARTKNVSRSQSRLNSASFTVMHNAPPEARSISIHYFDIETNNKTLRSLRSNTDSLVLALLKITL